MKISLCMIVKNEQDNLRQCLESICAYVNEIIIVDTGSTDNTIDIAKQYTDKVYDFIWNNNFSDARNFSLKMANNPWVVVLDADETIIKFNKASLFKLKDEEQVGNVKVISDFEYDGDLSKSIDYLPRVFNKMHFHYEGNIHEQLISNDRNKYERFNLDIELHHIGYSDEIMINKNKSDRNISLLKIAINEVPNDPYLYYQLGKSYFKNKNFKMAKKNFKMAIELCVNFKDAYIEDLIESYGYTLLKCENFEEALELQTYQIYYWDSPDYNFLMGLIYMNNGIFQESVKFFEKCIGDKEGKVSGINSYKSIYNVGVIYEMLGLNYLALIKYKECGNYHRAKKRIIHISGLKLKKESDIKLYKLEELILNGELDQAEKIIKNNLLSKNDLEMYSILSVIKIMKKQFNEAELILNTAARIENNNVDILYNLAYLYKLTNREPCSMKLYKKILNLDIDNELKKEIVEKMYI